MKNIYITTEELSKLKLFTDNNEATEGGFYQHLTYLYKIFKNSDLEEKEDIIDGLLEYGDIENCVMPEKKIYIDNNFAGFSMNYLNDYQTLHRTLKDDKIDYKTRLLLCRKVVTTIKKIHDLGIGYDDVNLYNAITKDKDIKLIDMDGCLLEKLVCNDEYQELKQMGQYNSAILVLSYLYKVDIEDMIYKHGVKFFKSVLRVLSIDNEFKQYINYLLDDKDVGNNYVDQYLDSFSKKNIEFDNNHLVKYFK